MARTSLNLSPLSINRAAHRTTSENEVDTPTVVGGVYLSRRERGVFAN
jgi:hypothetical protein